VKYSLLGTKKIPLGESTWVAAPNINLGPPVILETTRDRKLNLETISYGQVGLLISDINKKFRWGRRVP